MRLLAFHEKVELSLVTSRKHVGKPISSTHTHLTGKVTLKYEQYSPGRVAEACDLAFLSVPHGAAQDLVAELLDVGVKVVDLSADYRLRNQGAYEEHYGPHRHPELLASATYGLPELHADEIKNARLVANPGCHAASAILATAPLASEGLLPGTVVVDSKTGSSGSGAKVSEASHHPVRTNSVRPYKLVGHRHTPEVEQELGLLLGEKKVTVAFSAIGVNVVRGISSTVHLVYPNREGPQFEERFLFKTYRGFYGDSPFTRVVKRSTGVFRLPDPKLVVGTNYCDVGFEVDDHANRVVLVSALDNLLKGAAGNAVQCMNLMAGFDEDEGLPKTAPFP